MKLSRKILLVSACLVLVAMAGLAQRFGGRFFGGGGGGGDPRYARSEGGEIVDTEVVKTAREIASHSTGTPIWTNHPAFPRDTFTFVRIIRDRQPYGYGSDSSGNWITDFPDSDLNLSFRVQQMTSIKVNPDGRILRLTDPELFDYPWIYMVEVGSLRLRDDEVVILRNYLLNGGFLMVDDFWGSVQWEVFAREMKRVFPAQDFSDLPPDHPIFSCVFPLKGPIEGLQVPGIRVGRRGWSQGVTWEYHDGQECRPIHIRGLFDGNKRLMVIATHNTDNGDGWEREGEDDDYFHHFSEKISFPLGINIIFYAMTH